MQITYLIDEQGGFTCGDRETKRTAYAYPTSPSAAAASRGYAVETAQAMLRNANAMPESRITRAHDNRNWHALFLANPSRAVDVTA